MSDELARLTDAAKTLAEVSSASEAWELARTAEAARRYAQLKGLGHEAVNYATAIKAKSMCLLADFVDAGQADGSIAKKGRPENTRIASISTLSELLPDSENPSRDVSDARKLRDDLDGADVDALVANANTGRKDFGLAGLRQAAAATRTAEPVREAVPPRDGEYACIVIDPPWPMANLNRRERPNQDESRYPVQSVNEIADEHWVPVRQHAADACHIYLWVTQKYLPSGLWLLEQWGFHYQCVMTWRKNVGITPYSWMYDTEHVLFGTRGNLPLQRKGLRLSFEAPAQGHSVKPDVFYERVAEASPGPRIDMFPGVEHDGFEPWGLEASHRAV